MTPWSLSCLLPFVLFLAQWLVDAHVADPAPRVWLVALHPPLSASQLPPWDATHSRAQRRHQVASFFEASARDAQLHARSAIASFASALVGEIPASSETVRVENLWIQNTLVVRLPRSIRQSDSMGQRFMRRLDTFLMEQLRWLPGVVSVERDGASGLLLLQPSVNGDHEGDHDLVASSTPQKNIRLVHAPELWAQASLQGQGVTVASIDSGVRYTHEALAATFRGAASASKNLSFDYAFWFPPGTDVGKETPDTADEVGHGTHTVGTAVGAQGIGVAPRATWIAARAFGLQGAVSKSDFLLATQWVLCPTKVDGTHKNCSLGADVITGSFGVDRSDVATLQQWTWLTHIIQVWRAAGSYAVFASGNTNGFKCGSVYYPASREESVAVGALLGGSTLWGASGKGPSVENDEEGVNGKTILKPEFVAPGGAIRSALSTTDTAYTRMTGTSMATPHVAGMLALLLSGAANAGASRRPDLIAALQQTASHALSKPFLVPSTCGGTRYNQFPNNIYGYGLPDVCTAATSGLGVKCKSAVMEVDRTQTLDERTEILSVE